jgi:hypothetical protein
MRRNRKRGKARDGGPPTLTDALGVDHSATLAPTIILPEPAAAAADPISLDTLADPMSPDTDPMSLDTLADVPVLTDVVDVWPAPAHTWPSDAPDAGADARDDALAAALEADAMTAIHQEREAPAGIADARPATDEPSAASDASPIDEWSARTPWPQRSAASESAEPGVAAKPDGGAPDGDPARSPSSPSAADASSAADAPLAADAPSASAAGAVSPFAPASVADLSSAAAIAPTTAEPPSPVVQDEEFILEIPPIDREPATPSSDAPARALAADMPPTLTPGTGEWDAMAEEIRMQVLQRLDLFTDTGMRDQLGARLQPIVARASAELVESINQALGELVRGYVAEAIEREIDSWRKRSG